MSEWKNGRLQLPNVTLIAVTSVDVGCAVAAIKYSCREVDFGEVTLVTHKKPLGLPKWIDYQHIDIIDNIDKFNYAMVYDLHKYVHKDYALLIHSDGYVVNASGWRDEFFNYDYIGAPWPLPPEDDKVTYRDEYGTLYRVGNSVSLRSKALMELPTKISLEWEAFHGWYNEDGFICVNRRKVFEEHGMKYADVATAAKFSQEVMIPECEGVDPFCFHKWYGKNEGHPHFSNYRIKNFMKFGLW